MTTENYTLEEILICRMAREFTGERIAASATILADMSARLAKSLYEPDLLIAAGGSQASLDAPVGSRYLTGEWETGTESVLNMDWRELFEAVIHGKLLICMGPVQIDKAGNANISVLGSWDAPKVQLIGARGLPDDLWGNEKFIFHVSRHTKRSFVDQVDFKCSIGFGPERARLGLSAGKPKMAMSDLGVFTWDEEGIFRIESLHPGVTFQQVQENTGFTLQDDPDGSYPVTAAPTAEELRCLREKIDPAGWRLTESKTNPVSMISLALQEVASITRT